MMSHDLDAMIALSLQMEDGGHDNSNFLDLASIDDHFPQQAAAATHRENVTMTTTTGEEANLVAPPTTTTTTKTTEETLHLDEDEEISMAIARSLQEEQSALDMSLAEATTTMTTGEESNLVAPPPTTTTTQTTEGTLHPDEDEEIIMAVARSLREEQSALDMSLAEAWRMHDLDFDTLEQEEAAMTTSTMGRSVVLARCILEFHAANQFSHVEPVSTDDIVFMAQKFLECQEHFERNGIPSLATIAYHYTSQQSLESIKENGLLTPKDQSSQNITSGRSTGHGTFGSGVYMGSNPYAFNNYGGGFGLVVAVLLGRMCRVNNSAEGNESGKTYNTVVGNKQWTIATDEAGHFSDEYVVQQSWQCLPLFKFEKKLGAESGGPQVLWQLHEGVQAILDEWVNGGQRTKLVRILPSHRGQGIGALGGISSDQQRYLTKACTTASRAASLRSDDGAAGFGRQEEEGFTAKVFCYEALDRVDVPVPEEHYTLVARRSTLVEECPICLEPLASTKKVASLRKCRHTFHEDCFKLFLLETLGQSLCPVCCEPVAVETGGTAPPFRGDCPSGTLTISKCSETHCSGYDNVETWNLDYNLPSGIQKVYHDNPGDTFVATKRRAYLPDTEEGRRVLNRLVYAWMHGLTFTLVKSTFALGKRHGNTVIKWGAISHKTNLDGGSMAYGFPDEGYFLEVNDQLNLLGVPNWLECMELYPVSRAVA